MRLERGNFGAFLAQRVVEGLREEAQLSDVLKAMDFSACLGEWATSPQQAVAVKLAEACLRLRACREQCASCIFDALGVTAASHGAWATLIMLWPTESLNDLLWDKGGDGSEGHSKATVSSGQLVQLPPLGVQLLCALLRFPGESVQPLVSSMYGMVKERHALRALAQDAKTARIFEAALAPSSALGKNGRLRLAQSFKGLMGALGPHPVGGWVCVAAWRVSLGHKKLRNEFVKELLAVEVALKELNFAVWKLCGLHAAKLHREEWQQRQKLAWKTTRLFNDILDTGDQEAAKADAAARKRAEQDAAKREVEMAMSGKRPRKTRPAATVTAQEEKAPAQAPAQVNDEALQETFRLLKAGAPKSVRKRRRRMARETAEG